MSTFSDEMATLATELLTEFGEAVTITRTTPGAYDPATGTTAAGTPASVTGYGYAEDYREREIDNESIQRGDIKVYVNQVATAPIVGDELTINSTDYRIVNVRRIRATNATVLYELQVRL